MVERLPQPPMAAIDGFVLKLSNLWLSNQVRLTPFNFPIRYHNGPTPAPALCTSTTVLPVTATCGLNPVSYCFFSLQLMAPPLNVPERVEAVVIKLLALTPSNGRRGGQSIHGSDAELLLLHGGRPRHLPNLVQ
jgi:hypothetical protein